MQQARLDQLASRLRHRFARPELLVQALLHPSALPHQPGSASDFERLEFLGDRVLGLVIADLLSGRFPGADTGAMARRYNALVRRETLSEVAGALGLGDCLELSKGESEGGGRDNPAILADACEAVIAALYLDGGLAAAQRFIHRYWADRMAALTTPPTDAKTALQEWALSLARPAPTYREVERVGPAHEPVFTVEVTVEGLPPTSGSGRSKRQAEQAAAEALLEIAGASVEAANG